MGRAGRASSAGLGCDRPLSSAEFDSARPAGGGEAVGLFELAGHVTLVGEPRLRGGLCPRGSLLYRGPPPAKAGPPPGPVGAGSLSPPGMAGARSREPTRAALLHPARP